MVYVLEAASRLLKHIEPGDRCALTRFQCILHAHVKDDLHDQELVTSAHVSIVLHRKPSSSPSPMC